MVFVFLSRICGFSMCSLSLGNQWNILEIWLELTLCRPFPWQLTPPTILANGCLPPTLRKGNPLILRGNGTWCRQGNDLNALGMRTSHSSVFARLSSLLRDCYGGKLCYIIIWVWASFKWILSFLGSKYSLPTVEIAGFSKFFGNPGNFQFLNMYWIEGGSFSSNNVIMKF